MIGTIPGFKYVVWQVDPLKLVYSGKSEAACATAMEPGTVYGAGFDMELAQQAARRNLDYELARRAKLDLILKGKSE